MKRKDVQAAFDQAMVDLSNAQDERHFGRIRYALDLAADWAAILTAFPEEEPVSMVEGVPQYEFDIFGDGTNGGFFKDFCYTVFNIAKAESANAPGEPSDWMNDTLPRVDHAIVHLRKLVNATIDAAIKDGYRVPESSRKK